LVFEDEFEGTDLNLTKWSKAEGYKFEGHTVPEAVYLNGNGRLVLKSFKENGEYKTGRIFTKEKAEIKYGYFEIRIKFHEKRGHWPTFWLFSDATYYDPPNNSSEDGAEIDIVEKPWIDGKFQNAIHWDGYDSGHQSISKITTNNTVEEGFHTFGLLWTPTTCPKNGIQTRIVLTQSPWDAAAEIQ
jgi:beta-glucanase (GH16 family)